MSTYVILINWTAQGVKEVKETLNRAKQAESVLSDLGATMTNIYWTTGRYDLIVTIDAPDDTAMTAAALKLSSMGAIRTETLRAFNESEMSSILEKVG